MNCKAHRINLSLVALLLGVLSHASLGAQDRLVVMSYNVENLFDTIAHDMRDTLFAPTSSMKWSKGRYQKKIRQIAQSIVRSAEWELPDLVAIQEVESEMAIRDLVYHPMLSTSGYHYTMTHGDDPRGIQVALLYRPNRLQCDTIQEWGLWDVAHNTPLASRRLLYVRMRAPNQQTLHIIACHLPSRRNLNHEWSPQRKAIWQTIQQKKDSLFRIDPQSAIILLGDLNCPFEIDQKLTKTIEALPCDPTHIKSQRLYDLMPTPTRQFPYGSYYFRKRWQYIDRIIVSTALVQGGKNKWIYRPRSARACASQELYHPNKGKRPKRTWAGNAYLGGTSDHFPVMAIFDLEIPSED